MYYIAEYTGATTGGLISFMIGGEDVALIYPAAKSGVFRAFMAELVFTFILATVILHVATDKRQSGNQHYGMAIGLCVTVSIMCIGEVSGCCLNSAVWVGTVIPALLANEDTLDLSDAWIYWIAPFMGSAIAAVLFNIVFERGSQGHKATDEKCVSFTSFSREMEAMKVICTADSGSCQNNEGLTRRKRPAGKTEMVNSASVSVV